MVSGYFLSKFQIPNSRLHSRGIATLPTVMLLGIMALAVAVGITAIAFSESFVSQGNSQSSRALFYAEAGARDALVKIARNKNYTCSGTAPDYCYTIDFSINGCSLGNDCAKVAVSTGVGTTGDPKIVTSKGIMRSSTRTLQVSVVLDNGTSVAVDQQGVITGATWSEVTN